MDSLSLSQLSAIDLKAVCESLGMSFNVVGECEKLEVSGNMAALDDGIKAAIKAHRDDLMALVWLVDMHGESFSDVPTGAWRELDGLINAYCDKSHTSTIERERMLQASKTMRPMDIPHCIDYFKRCIGQLERGGQMQRGH